MRTDRSNGTFSATILAAFLVAPCAFGQETSWDARSHSTSWAAGGGKSYKQTDDDDPLRYDDPDDRFFRGGEWSMGLAATSLIGRGGQADDTFETVRRTETETVTTTTNTPVYRSTTVPVQQTVTRRTVTPVRTTERRLVFDGIGFRLQNVTVTRNVVTTSTSTQTVNRQVQEIGNLQQTNTREVSRTVEEQRRIAGRPGNFKDYAAGAQLDVSYFFNPYFGLQPDVAVLGGDTGNAFTWIGFTAVARYPIEFEKWALAPYVKAGPYVDIGEVSRVGFKALGGVEIRFTRNLGIFTEGGFRYHDSKEYAAILSSGFRITFGGKSSGPPPLYGKN